MNFNRKAARWINAKHFHVRKWFILPVKRTPNFKPDVCNHRSISSLSVSGLWTQYEYLLYMDILLTWLICNEYSKKRYNKKGRIGKLQLQYLATGKEGMTTGEKKKNTEEWATRLKVVTRQNSIEEIKIFCTPLKKRNMKKNSTRINHILTQVALHRYSTSIWSNSFVFLRMGVLI